MWEAEIEVPDRVVAPQIQSAECRDGVLDALYHVLAPSLPAVVLPFPVVGGYCLHAHSHDGDRVVPVGLAVAERGAAGLSNALALVMDSRL